MNRDRRGKLINSSSFTGWIFAFGILVFIAQGITEEEQRNACFTQGEGDVCTIPCAFFVLVLKARFFLDAVFFKTVGKKESCSPPAPAAPSFSLLPPPFLWGSLPFMSLFDI